MITILKVSLLFGLIFVTLPIVFIMSLVLFGRRCEVVIHRDISLGRSKKKFIQSFIRRFTV